MRTVLELEALASQAIKAALSQEWSEAVQLNQEYLQDDPESIEASNRLARAYQELGDSVAAKETYQRVLTLDPYNPIAQKNLEKLAQGVTGGSAKVSRELFLEEPGKTRITTIVQPQQKRLSHVSAGEPITLEEREHRLAFISTDGHVLGYLPDELAGHLLNLLHLGNTYSAHIMSTGDQPQVFLRETSQSPRAAKFISFTRQHVLNHQSDGKSMLLSDEAPQLTGEGAEEGLGDDWDSESGTSENLDDLEGDELSLDHLREEEEESYGRRGRSEDY